MAIRSKENALYRDELRRLFDACKDADEKILIVLAGGLGLRAGEIANLKKSWIDFQSSKIRIPKRDGSFKAKTKNSARTIFYGAQPQSKAVIEYYFALNERIGLTRESVYRKIRRIATRAGLTKKVTPHSLRATAALQFAEAGLSAQALREVMGWSKLETAES